VALERKNPPFANGAKDGAPSSTSGSDPARTLRANKLDTVAAQKAVRWMEVCYNERMRKK